MPLRVEPDATFRDALRNQTGAAGRPLAGMWVCSGSPWWQSSAPGPAWTGC